MSSNDFQEVIPSEIITNKTKRTVNPQILIDNPLSADIFCNGIECLLSLEFTRKGILIIEINNVRVFDSRDSTFKNYSKFPVAVGKKLLQNKQIKIWAYNNIDSNTIQVNFNTSLGKTFQPINTLAVPVNPSQVNDFVDTVKELFPFKLRANITETKLLNMDGYHKMIVNLAASDIPLPSFVSENVQSVIFPSLTVAELSDPSFPLAFLFSDQPTIFTNDIQTITDTLLMFPPVIQFLSFNTSGFFETKDVFTVYDFLDGDPHTVEFNLFVTEIVVATNAIRIRAGVNTDSRDYGLSLRQTTKIQIEESDSPTSGFSVVDPFGSVQAAGDKSFAGITKRYVRITLRLDYYIQIEFLNVNSSTFGTSIEFLTLPQLTKISDRINNVIDGTRTGGTSLLSFEELDESNGVWDTYIPSDAFLTVTEGEAKKVQIGDTANLAENGKTYILPPTQTGFRAKLEVTGGGNQTGVSVRLMN